MNSFDKVLQLREEITQCLIGRIDADYWLLDVPYHPNIGDTLIWQGEIDYLKTLPYRCKGVASLNSLKTPEIKDGDLVLFHGGGNFGDVWKEPPDYKRRMMRLAPHGRFLFFPQTVFWGDPGKLREDAEFFAKYDCTICARDKRSFELLKTHFRNEILLVPDMAFFMDMSRWMMKAYSPSRPLFVKRGDLEFKGNAEMANLERREEIDISDWPTMTGKIRALAWQKRVADYAREKPQKRGWLYDFYMQRFFRPAMIREGVDFISSHTDIYATRLHACILSVLLGKKNINLFDNSYGKNSSFYETWLADCDGVNLMQNAEKETGKAYVSVIVPVYNQAKWLRECLDSILLQTYRDIEVICVDDGSTDDSLSILQTYAAHDARVVVIRQENRGVSAARNVALDAASGEWVMFMDGDDLYPDQEVISDVITSAEAAGVEICGGGVRVVGSSWSESGFLFKKDGVMNYRDYQYDYGFWRFAYKLDLLKRNNIRFPDLIRQEDPVFFVRAMIAAGKFNALKRLTYLYRASQSYSKVDWFAPPHLCAKDTLSALVQEMEMANRDDLSDLRRILFRRLLDFTWLWEKNLIVELRKELCEFFSVAGVRVSVVIPVYNVEHYLRECLDSVVGQVFPQLEIICVNDGSTDGSRKILDEYPQVRIIDQTNRGLGAARNVGLDAATGKYIYFLDSDDKILPETIAYLVSKCEAESLDQIIFEAEPFSDDQAVTAENLAKERHYHTVHSSLCDQVFPGPIFLKNALPYDLPVTQQVRFFRRAFLMEQRLRYPEGILHEDNAFAWISAFLSERIYAVEKRYYLRRVRRGSIMYSTDNLIRRSDGCLRNIELLLAFRPFWQGSLELRKAVLQYCVGPLLGNALLACGDEWRWRTPVAPELCEASARLESSIPQPFVATFLDCVRDAPGRIFAYSLPWGLVLAYKKLFGRPMLKHTVFTRRCRWIKYLFPYGFIRYWTRRRFGEL